MNYRIITISREFGSVGRTIGKALADTLGYLFAGANIAFQGIFLALGYGVKSLVLSKTMMIKKSYFAYDFLYVI